MFRSYEWLRRLTAAFIGRTPVMRADERPHRRAKSLMGAARRPSASLRSARPVGP